MKKTTPIQAANNTLIFLYILYNSMASLFHLGFQALRWCDFAQRTRWPWTQCWLRCLERSDDLIGGYLWTVEHRGWLHSDRVRWFFLVDGGKFIGDPAMTDDRNVFIGRQRYSPYPTFLFHSYSGSDETCNSLPRSYWSAGDDEIFSPLACVWYIHLLVCFAVLCLKRMQYLLGVLGVVDRLSVLRKTINDKYPGKKS